MTPLERLQQREKWALDMTPKRPHKCPVCGGKGIVPQGFYSTTGYTWGSTSTAPDQCRSCGGRGIVIA